MKSIVLKDGSEWACSNSGEGVFSRRKDGSFQQHTGTGQTPRFRDPGEFSRYIHKNYRERDGDKLPRMVRSYGW